LAYNYDINRASNFSYDVDMDDTKYQEDIELEKSTDKPTKSLNSISKTIETQAL
jgi:hypothetical protein